MNFKKLWHYNKPFIGAIAFVIGYFSVGLLLRWIALSNGELSDVGYIAGVLWVFLFPGVLYSWSTCYFGPLKVEKWKKGWHRHLMIIHWMVIVFLFFVFHNSKGITVLSTAGSLIFLLATKWLLYPKLSYL